MRPGAFGRSVIGYWYMASSHGSHTRVINLGHVVIYATSTTPHYSLEVQILRRVERKHLSLLSPFKGLLFWNSSASFQLLRVWYSACTNFSHAPRISSYTRFYHLIRFFFFISRFHIDFPLSVSFLFLLLSAISSSPRNHSSFQGTLNSILLHYIVSSSSCRYNLFSSSSFCLVLDSRVFCDSPFLCINP